jgi:hypothetical protein
VPGASSSTRWCKPQVSQGMTASLAITQAFAIYVPAVEFVPHP